MRDFMLPHAPHAIHHRLEPGAVQAEYAGSTVPRSSLCPLPAPIAEELHYFPVVRITAALVEISLHQTLLGGTVSGRDAP